VAIVLKLYPSEMCTKYYYCDAGISSDRSSCISSSESVACSKRGIKGLKEYLKILIDVDIFSDSLEDWVLEKPSCSSADKALLLKSPSC